MSIGVVGHLGFGTSCTYIHACHSDREWVLRYVAALEAERTEISVGDRLHVRLLDNWQAKGYRDAGTPWHVDTVRHPHTDTEGHYS